MRLVAAALVHPHRRGDGALVHPSSTAALGSPPQAWGRHVGRCHRPTRHRFTPTGVGTARSLPTPTASASVHPHRRGDGRHPTGNRHLRVSSPPQAWGRHLEVFASNGQHRFTPTGVGTARSSASKNRPCTVHPHRRGDGNVCAHTCASIVGSPPQAWGRRLGHRREARHPRFTPTGVGTAPFRSSARRCQAVHPHRRGDGITGVSGYGLTPVHPHRRGDGTQNRCLIPPPSRFTPTGVGTATT